MFDRENKQVQTSREEKNEGLLQIKLVELTDKQNVSRKMISNLTMIS